MRPKISKDSKSTKQLQLIAVLLTGTFSIIGSFITAAKIIENICMVTLFCISSVVLAGLVLVMIFLLLTKYRPQLQDDEYYSKYVLNEIADNIRGVRDLMEDDGDNNDDRIDDEVNVLLAISDSKYSYRLADRMAKELNISVKKVNEMLESLLAEGLVKKKQSTKHENTFLWGLTPKSKEMISDVADS